MQEEKRSLTPQYFDDVYNAAKDPWNFETSPYEKEKYKVTINALPKILYQNVFEIGCSIGVLSEMLVLKAGRLLCVDAVEDPLVKARERLKKYPNVLIKKMIIPFEFGKELYDLIVISEVAYYLNDQDLEILRNKVVGHLTAGGQLLMVHWTPLVHDYPQTGDEVHDYFMELDNKNLKHLHNERHDTYRLDLFEKI